MQEERIKILEEFIAQEPDDPFNYYALGIEFININPNKTIELFELVIKKEPEYLAVYYHLANLYFEKGRLEAAEDTFKAGIELAQVQNNQKALREIKGAYQLFLDEIDD